MQGICSDDAVQAGKIELASHVLREDVQKRAGKNAVDSVCKVAKRALIGVHGYDFDLGPRDITQRKSKRAIARSHVCPMAADFRYALCN